ncbi:hypothetical protein [Ensifer sp. YR511]|uniref:hypothetical protein n=1 Tax=Ensifer sp. YR511 TaxID=1855294 RepID=UPI00088970FA|nr:hypothetical protein [Ensifer sp. YR511]SDM70255.1 hypothetical protein SAMN05216328_112191 [Ensifer sp. YR511]
MTGDTIARIWDVASSRETTRLETDGDAVEYGTFSPDGRGELIAFAHSIVLRDLTPCERKRFFLPVDGQRAECRS